MGFIGFFIMIINPIMLFIIFRKYLKYYSLKEYLGLNVIINMFITLCIIGFMTLLTDYYFQWDKYLDYYYINSFINMILTLCLWSKLLYLWLVSLLTLNFFSLYYKNKTYNIIIKILIYIIILLLLLHLPFIEKEYLILLSWDQEIIIFD